MTSRPRILLRGGAALAGILIALLAVFALVMFATVPPYSGRMGVAGLSAEVEIVRDEEAVPHILAAYSADAYAALGFVHAQDRLFQMELARRAAQGRLSELFGARTLETDILLRTLDLYGHAERAVERLSPRAQSLLEAYARGINAFLQRRTGTFEARYPPELLLLGHRPEPWRPADSIAVLKMMALTLGTNARHEVSRLVYAAQGLAPAEIDDLMPQMGPDTPPPLPDLKHLYSLNPPSPRPPRSATAELGPVAAGGASNNWVVAGARTASGAPLLANDPHLGLSAPSIWYLVHISLPGAAGGPPIAVVGASLPGTPLVPLGRGSTLAWGATNAEVDAQDLYIEQINPQNRDEYLTPDGWRPFAKEKVTIKVKGGQPRVIERRRTRHGPVLPASAWGLGDVLPPQYVAALRWTALEDDDRTIEAGLIDARLRTVADYIETMRAVTGPVQNFAVADTEGNIAITAPGLVPIRGPENRLQGRAPAPGWDPRYDWQGYIPFEQLPRIVNPPSGAVGTANSDLLQRGYPHRLTWDWDADYRQRRIAQVVVSPALPRHDLATMREAQLDELSLAARELLPLMVAAARRGDWGDIALLDRLAAWDGRMRRGASEPLLYMAWMREAVRGIYADDLGPAFERYFVPQAPALVRLLSGRATARPWCDDRTTSAEESCETVLAAALGRALAVIEEHYGSDRRSWRWADAHTAIASNQFWDHLPLLGPLLWIRKPGHGGAYTLNRGTVSFAAERLFASEGGSTYRGIYDLSDLDWSLYIQATGQSGNPFSRYYRNFAERWARGEYIRIATGGREVRDRSIGSWRLRPR